MNIFSTGKGITTTKPASPGMTKAPEDAVTAGIVDLVKMPKSEALGKAGEKVVETLELAGRSLLNGLLGKSPVTHSEQMVHKF